MQVEGFSHREAAYPNLRRNVADAALALMTILAAKYKQLKSQLRVREIVDTVKSNVGFCRHHLTSCISLTWFSVARPFDRCVSEREC